MDCSLFSTAKHGAKQCIPSHTAQGRCAQILGLSLSERDIITIVRSFKKSLLWAFTRPNIVQLVMSQENKVKTAQALMRKLIEKQENELRERSRREAAEGERVADEVLDAEGDDHPTLEEDATLVDDTIEVPDSVELPAPKEASPAPDRSVTVENVAPSSSVKRKGSEASVPLATKASNKRFKSMARRQPLSQKSKEDIVISFPKDVSTKTHVPDLVEAADTFYFPADAARLNQLKPSEFYERAVKHCYKSLQSVVGLQTHYSFVLADKNKHKQEKKQLAKELEGLKDARAKGESLEQEVKSLKDDLGKTVAQFSEAASRAKISEERAQSLSDLVAARDAEIERSKKVYADLEAAKLALEVDLANERKKFELLEIESASKEVNTRIFALEQIVSGSLTIEKAKEELELLQSVL